MPDVPLVNRTLVAAPKDYQVPQAQEILLKAVAADIDGSGAATTFQPALQLISDAGDVMWTATDPNVTIAAGGSATVSWFPGVRKAPGATASTGLATMGGINNIGTQQTITAGGSRAIAWDTLATNAPTYYDVGAGHGNAWHILKDGIYQIAITLNPDVAWPTVAAGELTMLINPGLSAGFYMSGWESYFPGGNSPGYWGVIWSVGGGGPYLIRTQVNNFTASNITVDGGVMAITRLGDVSGI